MDQNQAILRIQKSRQELLLTIQGLSEAELTSVAVEGIWTVKDLLGHITAWELSCLEPLERLAQKGSFECDEIPDHDAWNAIQAARRKDTPTHAVLEEMQEVRRRLLDAARQCSSDQWAQNLHVSWGETTTLAGMLNGLAWHEEEHLKSILRPRTS